MLWLILAAFVSDWSLHLSLPVRGIILFGWSAACLWTIKRLIWPVVTIRESLDDVAVLVERKLGIDSDLVAALQFDVSSARTWGSTTLIDALIDDVAGMSSSLNFALAFTYRPLPNSVAAVGLTLLIVALGMVILPEQTATFSNRFLLGSASYPTSTVIQLLEINQQTIDPQPRARVSPIRVRVGQTVSLKVHCSGNLPGTGIARLADRSGESRNQITLRPSPLDCSILAGELPHVGDSFHLQILVGDAVSPFIDIDVIPDPAVDVAWEVSAPHYATTSLEPSDVMIQSYQLSVLENSSLKLKLVSPNKRLASAQLTADGVCYHLVPANHADGSPPTWTLPDGTPFESVQRPLQYEIQVVDQDFLTLERPVTGQLRIRPDLPPRIVVKAVTRRVLPSARPKIDYVVQDDFGVASVEATVRISREDGRTTEHEMLIKSIEPNEQPVKLFSGQQTLPLAAYELKKGDEIILVLKAIDWRGGAEGQFTLGEPVIFPVTDLDGILNDIGEEDKKSAKQLDEILKRELEIGSGHN